MINGCSSDNNSGSSTTAQPTQPSNGGCDGIGQTSSATLGHTHGVCVVNTLLTAPPAEGVTIPTTTTEGHAHAIVLTQLQLRQLQAGNTVTIITTTVESHTHGFTLHMGTTTSTGTQPGY